MQHIGVRGFVVAVLICACLLVRTATADTLKSNNYQLDESELGGTSNNSSNSASYGLASALGDLGVGTSASSNYQTNSGSITSSSPTLAFSVNSTAANFGTLSASSTATATTTFSVRNYTTYGYVVQITGGTPTNSGYTIPAMNVLGPSQAGVEQFGINLVANTSPSSLGANPDNGQFGFGSITSNYATANKYFYQNGDTIAQAVKDSGTTNYTISYIMNVTGHTAGGTYTAAQTLVVVGTY